jgi:hypothetical protein
MPDTLNQQPSGVLQTLGGRISCLRCSARSKRTKLPCQQPAMRGRSTCYLHGGRSLGVKTPEGRARIAAAHTVHGRETRAIRRERSKQLAYLAELEELARVLGLISGPRSPGRSPGYRD